MKILYKLIFISSLIMSTNQVSATTISATLNGWENDWNEGALFSFNGGYGTTSGGLFNFTNNTTSSDFLAFCIEINEPIGIGDTVDYTIYPATDPLPLGTGSEVADYIGRLYTNAYSNVTDEATAAAFQFALWEIMHEDYNTNGFDLSTGDFQMVQIIPSGILTAENYLNSLGSWSNDVIVDVYRNDGHQDLLQVYPEPPPINVNEPFSLSLLGFGLMGLALKLKRKQ
ncbi:thioester domain-containing protein [Moritella sp. 28]|uniref:thioester domain-containing protein n=2 Tax=unclassified Moritella TaxID=2637987 RepID=UPI001BA9DD32|nr:thioester domain-containing protein [Moritella sp. 28]QUM85318.1 Cys-Gln thioester bond-forming surface protein [Moritella sp. 28]